MIWAVDKARVLSVHVLGFYVHNQKLTKNNILHCYKKCNLGSQSGYTNCNFIYESNLVNVFTAMTMENKLPQSRMARPLSSVGIITCSVSAAKNRLVQFTTCTSTETNTVYWAFIGFTLSYAPLNQLS